MRLIVFLFGAMCGVIGTLAWAMFAEAPPPAVVEQPARDDAPITLTFGKPLFDSLLQRTSIELPGGATTPINLRVELRDDSIAVLAELEILGRKTTGEALLKPVVRDGRLRVDVVKANLGAVPLPALEKVIEDHVNARLRSLLSAMPVTITGASVDHRGLVVSCRLDPPRPR